MRIALLFLLLFSALLPLSFRAAPSPARPTQTLAVAVSDNQSIILRRFRFDSEGRAVQQTRTVLTSSAGRGYPGQVAFSPDGRFVYVLSPSGSNIDQYRFLPDGSLSSLPIPFITAGPDATIMQFAPNGKYAYVICHDGIWQYQQRNDGQLVHLAVEKVVSGEATEKHQLHRVISKPGERDTTYEVETGDTVSPLSILFSADGSHAYVLNHEFYYKGIERVIPNWAVQGGGTNVDVFRWVAGFQVKPDGSLAPDLAPPVIVDPKVSALAIAPNGRLLSAVNSVEKSIYLCAVNGKGVVMPPIKTDVSGNALAFGPSGNIVYVSNNDTIRPYNLGAAVLTPLTPAVTLPNAIENLEHTISVVDYMRPDRTGRFLLTYYASGSYDHDIVAHPLLPDGSLGVPARERIRVGGIREGTIAVLPTSHGPDQAFQAPAKPSSPKPAPHRAEYMYVLHENKTISQYAVFKAGRLLPLTPPIVQIKSFTLPIWYCLAADSGGHHLYLMNCQLADKGDWFNEISSFAITSTGRLIQEAAVAKFSSHTSPMNLLIDPVGHVAYVSFDTDKGKIQAFPIRPNGTFASLPVETTFSDNSGRRTLFLNPGAHLLHTLNGLGQLDSYRIGNDGHLVHLSQAQPNSADHLTFDPSGRYAFCGDGYGSVWQYVIASDGALTPNIPPSVPADQQPQAVAVDPAGRFAYAANGGAFYGDGSISQYRLDSQGRLTALHPSSIMTGTSPDILAVDPTGRFLYALDTHMHFPSGLSNEATNAISEYRISKDGTLTSLGHIKDSSVSRAAIIVQPKSP